MNDILFRPAVDADALCLGVLGTQVFLDTYATDGIDPSMAREVLTLFSTDAMLEVMARANSRFIVAEREGSVIGFAQLLLGAVHELVEVRPAAELQRLYVQERFTGLGLGTALIQQAEELARREGARALWLTGWIGNTRALEFYRRRGYTELGSTPYVFDGEEYENRLFARELSTPTNSQSL